jgi:hypothetical protein
MNAFSNLLRPWMRTLVLLLLFGAVPLQAFALQCQVRCALADPAMPGQKQIDAAMDDIMSGHDCHSAADVPDDCPNGDQCGAQCAAAHAIALPVTGATHRTAAIDQVSAQPAHDRSSHTPLPPERPPRHG